jgi:hypothetical protein
MVSFACYGKNAAMVFLQPFEAAIATFALIFMFGIGTIPFNYVLTFGFQSHSSAQISILIINFSTGFLATMAYLILNV